MSEQSYCSGCWTYHRKHERKKVDRYRVEVATVLDAIRFALFEKRVSEDVNNNTVFTEARNLFLVLGLGQYGHR